MSDIYLYGAEETDFDNIGLCGALLPNEAKFSEIANGNATLTLCHPRDEYGKFALIERGMILKAAVPVRTTPEITNGQFVTTVYEYTVSSTATKEQRKIWNTRDKTKQKRKCLKVAAKNDPIVIVKTFDNANYFYKVKYTYKSKKKNKTVTGFIDPAALQGPAVSKVIPATPTGMDSVADSWNVKDQLFRIENVEKTESEVNVTAHHISYDFMYNLTSYNFDGSKTLQEALDGVFGSCFEDHGFDAQTNITSTLTGFHYADKDPITAMMDPDIGLVPRFDGELVRDNYMFTILDHAGTNRGYRIEYGKNMTGISWQIDETSIAGAIRPYGETKKGDKLYLDHSYIANDDYTSLTQVSGDDKGLVYSPRYYTYTSGTLTNTLPYTRIYAFQGDDCKATVGPNDDPEASDITEAMVRTRLKDQSLKALKDGADVPEVSISVDIKQLGNSVQYADFAELEKVFLFDTVLVYHRRMGILADAVVSAIEWDVIQDELVGITLGTIRDLSQSVASWQIVQINGGKIMPSTIPGAAILPGTISAEKIIAKDITADQIAANTITANEIAAHTITADKLSAEVGEFTDLVVDNLNVDDLTADQVYAKFGNIDELVSKLIQVDDLQAQSAIVGTLEANYAHMTQGVIDNAEIGYASVKDLNANYAHISNGVIDNADIDVANIDNLSASVATISNGVINNATISYADVDDLNSHYAHISNGVIDNADIDVANIARLSANVATIQNGIINNAKIASADVNNLSAAAVSAVAADLGSANIDYLKSSSLEAKYAYVNSGYVVNLTADQIKATSTSTETLVASTGYINSAIVASGTIQHLFDVDAIDAVEINAGAITAGTMKAERLMLRNSTDGLYYQMNLAVSEDGSSVITPEQLATDEYRNYIHAESLIAGSITAREIHAGAITAVQIASETIEGARIVSGELVAGQIKSGSITTNELRDDVGTGLLLESNASITSLVSRADAIEGDLDETNENSKISMINQRLGSIEMTVSDDSRVTALETTVGGFNVSITDLSDANKASSRWLNFDGNYLTIADSENATGFAVHITNEKMSFTQGSAELAYVSNDAFMINEGEVKQTLRIGNFVFKPHASDGGMSLVHA